MASLSPIQNATEVKRGFGGIPREAFTGKLQGQFTRHEGRDFAATSRKQITFPMLFDNNEYHE